MRTHSREREENHREYGEGTENTVKAFVNSVVKSTAEKEENHREHREGTENTVKAFVNSVVKSTAEKSKTTESTEKAQC